MRHEADGRSWRSAPGPGRFRRRSGARCTIGTVAAASLAAAVRFGQGHHIRHWAHGGPTTLSNLALLCRRHHRAVHEEGYTVDRDSVGELRFRRPDGRPSPASQRLRTCRPIPSQAASRHDAAGVVLHECTATPRWAGERLDVGYAIDVMHPLAVRETSVITFAE